MSMDKENKKLKVYAQDKWNDAQLKAFLRDSLLSENLLVLFGAGASMDIEGPGMSKLWDGAKAKYKEWWDSFVKESFYVDKNLEELLSNAELVIQVKSMAEENTLEIKKRRDLIKKYIFEVCREISIENKKSNPYEIFIKKILLSRKMSQSRVKFFTLNYDTAIEQSSEKLGVVVNDGFLLSTQRTLRVEDFDMDVHYRENARLRYEDHFYEKLVHLYKIHGSTDWIYDGGFIKKRPDLPFDALKHLLIYPNANKYEETFNMPFLEMLARFQIELRKKNTTLFVIGYGMGDKHINHILESAISSPYLRIVFVSPNFAKKEGDTSMLNLLRKRADAYGDTLLVEETFLEFVGSEHLPDARYSHFSFDEEKNTTVNNQSEPPSVIEDDDVKADDIPF